MSSGQSDERAVSDIAAIHQAAERWVTQQRGWPAAVCRIAGSFACNEPTLLALLDDRMPAPQECRVVQISHEDPAAPTLLEEFLLVARWEEGVFVIPLSLGQFLLAQRAARRDEQERMRSCYEFHCPGVFHVVCFGAETREEALAQVKQSKDWRRVRSGMSIQVHKRVPHDYDDQWDTVDAGSIQV